MEGRDQRISTRNRNVEGHRCTLIQDEDAVVLFINSGACVDWRRKFRKFLMVDPKNPETKRVLKSTSQIRQEEDRHLRFFYHMIHPFSKARVCWENLMIFVYLILLIIIPIEITSYDNIDYRVLMAKLLFDAITWVDIALFFSSGYYDIEHQKIVLAPRKVALHYVFGLFTIDILSSGFINIIMYATHNANLYYFKAGMLLKLFRIPTMLRYIRNHCVRMNISSYNLKSLTFAICFTLLMVWATCIMFMFRSGKSNDDQEKFTNDMVLAEKLLISCREVVIRLMLAANRFSPEHTDYDLVFQILTMLCAMTLNMVMLATIMQIYNRHSSSKDKYNNIIQQLGEYMKYKELPGHLKEKVLHYVDFKFQKNIFREHDILDTLSTILRQDILLHNCKRLVERVDFFKDLPTSLIHRIVTKLKSEIYLPNDVIVQAGIAGNAMYFIYIGTVAVYTSTGKEICHLQDGGHFGEISLVINEPRVASCVAVKECELYRLSRKDFQEAIEPFPELSNKIRISALARLANTRKIMEQGN